MKVLVLGATGFIGSRLMATLAATPGIEPVAASRRASASASGKWQTVSLDTMNAQSLAQGLAGMDAVVNCVAGDAATIRTGASLLAEACRQAGVKTVVHLSSMAVYGSALGPVTEQTPLSKDAGWYGEAKCEAEASLLGLADVAHRVVVLRPGCVYGPGSEQWVGRIARLLKARRIGDLGAAGDGYSNLVHVDDVAQAVVGGLLNAQAQGSYNLSSPDSPCWNDYFVLLAKQLGYTPVRRVSGRQLKLDAKLVSIGLKVLEIAATKLKLNPRLVPDPLPPSLVRLWGQDIQLDSSRASADLITHWTPLDAGVRSSAQWARTVIPA